MFISIGRFTFTTEEVVQKPKLMRTFCGRLDHSLRKNCADDTLHDAWNACIKERKHNSLPSRLIRFLKNTFLMPNDADKTEGN